MRDVDEGHAEPTLHDAELDPQLLAELRVEIRERLVEQEDLGLDHECPRDRHSLLLTSRELAGPAIAEAREPDEGEGLVHPPLPIGGSDVGDAKAVCDVVPYGHMREQRVILEDHRGTTTMRRQVVHAPPADLDIAGVRVVEPGDHPQRRRLPATGRAEERRERAPRNVERDVVHGEHTPEPLGDVGDAEVDRLRHGRHQGRSGRARARRRR